MMLRYVYNLLLTFLVPLATLYLKFHTTYSPLLERFRPKVTPFSESPIWIHATSVGEVNTAQPLLLAIRKHWPNLPLLLTTSTVTGMQQAKSTRICDAIAWFPFDHPASVRGFLNRVNPRCLILIETELWPNILHYANDAAIPVAIVNGRISAKHYKRYTRARALFAPLLKTVALACMQTPLDAKRINHLGVLSEKTILTGNMKFDGANMQTDSHILDELRTTLKLANDTPVLIFGSSRPGDEAIAAKCLQELSAIIPELCLIIAPRHPKRIQEAIEPFDKIPYLLRSELITGETQRTNEPVIFVDVMGELELFYGLSTVAVIGGSFSEDVQGHNPIESAALGIPTIFGPHMKNFLAPAEILKEAGGAIQVNTSDELLQTLQHLLKSTEKRKSMSEQGRVAVMENRGVVEKTLDALGPLLSNP